MSDVVETIAAEAAEAAEAGHELTGERLKELVDAEAQAAEAETPEDEEGDGTDEPETVADDPLTQALAEYVGKVMDILGPDAPVNPCTYCQGKGFNAIELRQDTHSHICPDCDGFGEVITGSKVPGNEARMCPTCQRAGYIADKPEIVIPGVVGETMPPQVLTEAEVAEIVRKAQEQAGANAA